MLFAARVCSRQLQAVFFNTEDAEFSAEGKKSGINYQHLFNFYKKIILCGFREKTEQYTELFRWLNSIVFSDKLPGSLINSCEDDDKESSDEERAFLASHTSPCGNEAEAGGEVDASNGGESDIDWDILRLPSPHELSWCFELDDTCYHTSHPSNTPNRTSTTSRTRPSVDDAAQAIPGKPHNCRQQTGTQTENPRLGSEKIGLKDNSTGTRTGTTVDVRVSSPGRRVHRGAIFLTPKEEDHWPTVIHGTFVIKDERVPT